MAPSFPEPHCALVAFWSQARAVAPTEAFNGLSAPLTEESYQAVAAKRDDAEMKNFMLRVMDQNSWRLTEQEKDSIHGLVLWHSGTMATQSLAALQRELSHAPWPEVALRVLVVAVRMPRRAR